MLDECTGKNNNELDNQRLIRPVQTWGEPTIFDEVYILSAVPIRIKQDD